MDERAVSTVVGTVLLLSITVVFSGTMLWMMELEPQQPGPKVGTTSDLQVENPGTDNAVQVFKVKNINGETVDVDNIRMRVSGGGVTLDKATIRDTPALADGKWSPNEELVVELSTTGVCVTEGQELKYSIMHEPSKSIISQREVTVDRQFNFAYTDRIIRPQQDYNAHISAVYSQVGEVNTGDNTIRNNPVTASIRVGDSVYTPWTDGNSGDSITGISDNINSPDPKESYKWKSPDQTEGTKLSFKVTSWNGADFTSSSSKIKYNGEQYQYYTPNSLGAKKVAVDGYESGESNIMILSGGDKLPNNFVDKAGEKELPNSLLKKIDSNGQVNLDDDESVVLFELNKEGAERQAAGGGGEPDYNDLVLVVKFQPVGGANPHDAETVSETETRLICSG